MDTKKILQSAGWLLLLIILCSVIVRVLTKGETLVDYANSNPGIAFSTPEPIKKEELSQPTAIHTETSDSLSSESNQSNESSELLSEPTMEPILKENSFYMKKLSEEQIEYITGISYPVDSQTDITYDDLRYLNILYCDFEGNTQVGEIICNVLIADDLLDIFEELYDRHYQLERVSLIDEFDGNDDLSMEANNTSCFNYRKVSGTTKLSNHALGLAIDINPFYNPYIVYDKSGNGNDSITPIGSEIYVDRSLDFEHKIDENDLCYRLFKEHGFTWGGDWKSTKDYQHFQKTF